MRIRIGEPDPESSKEAHSQRDLEFGLKAGSFLHRLVLNLWLEKPLLANGFKNHLSNLIHLEKLRPPTSTLGWW